MKSKTIHRLAMTSAGLMAGAVRMSAQLRDMGAITGLFKREMSGMGEDIADICMIVLALSGMVLFSIALWRDSKSDGGNSHSIYTKLGTGLILSALGVLTLKLSIP